LARNRYHQRIAAVINDQQPQEQHHRHVRAVMSAIEPDDASRIRHCTEEVDMQGGHQDSETQNRVQNVTVGMTSENGASRPFPELHLVSLSKPGYVLVIHDNGEGTGQLIASWCKFYS
jgi:hypothetical protein